MPSNPSADFVPLVSRVQVGNAIGFALRLFVGRGRRYSVKQLANASGIKDRVIECAMVDPENVDYRPLPLEALTSIECILGPDFASERLRLACMAAFTLPDDGDTPPGAIAADSAEDCATVCRAASDGRFDETERQALTVVGSRMMSRGATLMRLRVAG